jgi:hypothetical protein
MFGVGVERFIGTRIKVLRVRGDDPNKDEKERQSFLHMVECST